MQNSFILASRAFLLFGFYCTIHALRVLHVTKIKNLSNNTTHYFFMVHGVAEVDHRLLPFKFPYCLVGSTDSMARLKAAHTQRKECVSTASF